MGVDTMTDKSENKKVCSFCEGEGFIITQGQPFNNGEKIDCPMCKQQGTGQVGNRLTDKYESTDEQKKQYRVKDWQGDRLLERQMEEFEQTGDSIAFCEPLEPEPIEVVIPAGDICGDCRLSDDVCPLHDCKLGINDEGELLKCQACLDKTPVRIRHETGGE